MTKDERIAHAEMASNVGLNLMKVVAKGTPPLSLGTLVLALVDASVKAALPGKQSVKNAAAYTAAGRKAFARKLARKVPT